MLAEILTEVFNWTVNLIDSLGYWGVYIGMFIESASIPLPSEIIMGFAGYLVYLGKMNLWLAGLVGALGNISGSTSMYILGLKGGRPLLDKYGKYLHITDKKMERVDGWFAKWGDEIVFLAQLLPGIRTYISFPAGLVKVNFPKFILYTFVGAFIWCTGLAYLAMKLGENWESLGDQMKILQLVVIIGALLGVFYGVYLLVKSKRK